MATPFPKNPLAVPHELHPGAVARAARTVMRRLQGKIAAGTYPVDLVRTQLCPEALAVIAEYSARFDPRGALAAACAELERVSAERIRSDQQRLVGLAGPWAEEHFERMDHDADSEVVRHVRASTMLVEALLSDPPRGSALPDRQDVTRLLGVAVWAVELAVQSQQAHFGITPSRVTVSELGTVGLAVQGVAIDQLAWQEARWSQAARWQRESARNYEPPLPRDGSADDGGFQSITEALQRNCQGETSEAQNAKALFGVDRALLAVHGYGLDAVLAVLMTVMAWPVPGEPAAPIGVTTRGHLVEDVSQWARLDPVEVGAAVDALALSGAGIREERFSYWKLEQRSNRLAARPLVVPPRRTTPDELWLLPRAAYYTRALWMSYFHDGRLPLPKGQLRGELRGALQAWRRLSEENLERARTYCQRCRTVREGQAQAQQGPRRAARRRGRPIGR
jgi:hypothetical protein